MGVYHGAAAGLVVVAMAAYMAGFVPAAYANHTDYGAVIDIGPGSHDTACIIAYGHCPASPNATIPAGGEVTWINNDYEWFTLWFSGCAFCMPSLNDVPDTDGLIAYENSGMLPPGGRGSLSVLFSYPGIYPYYVEVYPWIQGYVHVLDSWDGMPTHPPHPSIPPPAPPPAPPPPYHPPPPVLPPPPPISPPPRSLINEEYGPGATFQFQFGSAGSGPGEFLVPHSIAVDGHGNIAVVDILNNRIQVFYPNGTYAFQFGLNGSGYIGSIAFDPNAPYTFGRMFVSDITNHRIQVFSLAEFQEPELE